MFCAVRLRGLGQGCCIARVWSRVSGWILCRVRGRRRGGVGGRRGASRHRGRRGRLRRRGRRAGLGRGR
jgi:hypothetical protein